MKSFKDNTLIKWVYAYLDLFYKLFPILFVIYFFPLLINISILKWKSVDVFGLFRQAFTDVSALSQISIIYKILIVILNLSIIVIIFYSLKKLTYFMKNVFDGNPFCESNGKILKLIGIFIVTITIGKRFISVVMISREFNSMISTTYSILMRLVSFLSVLFDSYFVIGLFVVVLGEIIIHGAKIKEENDLTV
jgi:hypothetical protein